MFKKIAKSCLSVLSAKPAVEKTAPKSTTIVAKNVSEKDALVVDMMSAVF